MARKPRGIIVEGPDCSGKSSLVRRLKAELSGGWDVLQMGHKDGDQFKRYLGVYLQADRLLLDRSHFSEVVYGDLCRGGRHFAPWERALLDGIAEHDFVTVLCTAPVSQLWERYRTMNAAVVRGERAYIQAGGALQPAMSFSDLAQAQARFAEIVGPHSTAIYESDRVESLEHTVRVVLRQVSGAGPRTRAASGTRPVRAAELVTIEGSARSGVTQQLAEHLSDWNIIKLRHARSRAPFEQFLAAYLAADRKIFDGGHLTAMAEAGLLSAGSPGAAEARQLCQYVASRGFIIIGRKSFGPADGLICAALEKANVPFYYVDAEDRSSIAEIAAAIRNKACGTVATAAEKIQVC